MLCGRWRVDLVEGEHLLFGVVGRGRYGCSRCTGSRGRSGIHADSGVRDGIDYITLEPGRNGSEIMLGGRTDTEGCRHGVGHERDDRAQRRTHRLAPR